MMTLQTMIVKNGLIRTNDQYPRSPRQTIRMTKSTSSSFDAPNFKDRSSSFTAEVLFALRMNFAVALCHVVFLRNQAGVARCPGWLPRPLRRALPPGLGVSRCRNSAFFLALLGSASEARHVRFSNRPFGVKRFQTIHHYSVDVAHGLVLLFGMAPGALPSWDSRTRWNNLLGGLAVRRTVGPSGHANSPHPSSREGHHSTARWNSSFVLLD